MPATLGLYFNACVRHSANDCVGMCLDLASTEVENDDPLLCETIIAVRRIYLSAIGINAVATAIT